MLKISYLRLCCRSCCQIEAGKENGDEVRSHADSHFEYWCALGTCADANAHQQGGAHLPQAGHGKRRPGETTAATTPPPLGPAGTGNLERLGYLRDLPGDHRQPLRLRSGAAGSQISEWHPVANL